MIQNHLKKFFTIFVPLLPEGNFDIDAGDGDRGDHLGPPKSQNISKNLTNISYEIIHTSGHLHIYRKIQRNR